MNGRNLKILIAPNSMKGSMSAFEFADVVEAAFLKHSSDFTIRKVPVADGGDYTGEVLRHALKAVPVEVTVNDPLGRKVVAQFALSGNTAIIEMADASGMKLLGMDERDVMKASSYGTGELIAAAIARGCTEIVLGAGGSATVDGGAGIMEALGFEYFDKQGLKISGNGQNLINIKKVIKPEHLSDVTVKVITDVNNPLLGPEGAAAVFAPQKGAGAREVELLEGGLTNWCRLLEKSCGRRLDNIAGGGAAGGIAVPLMAYLNARVVPGTDFILDALKFEEQVQWADIVITGEGKIDSQTLNNKAPMGVATAAARAGKPVIAIGGSVDPLAAKIFTGGLFSFIPSPVSLQKAITNVRDYLFDFSLELAKILSINFQK